jgi:RecA-family ATPase
MSTEYRNGLRAVEDEPTWAQPCEWLDEFFCPTENLQKCFLDGRWKVDRWVIDGIIRSGSICLVAGPSNVGKTYIALDLILSVVLGEPFLGHFTCDRGPAIYIGGEGNKDMIVRRIVNILRGRGLNENEFFTSEKWKHLKVSLPSDFGKKYPAPLQNEAYMAELKWRLSSIPPQSRPRIFVWDPLSALVKDVDHDPGVIQQVINNMRDLNRLCDACSLILHHPKKAQTGAPNDRRNMIRGESSWINFVDDVLVVESDSENPNYISFWSNKSRDSASAKDSEAMFNATRTFAPIQEQIPGASPGAVQRVVHYYVSKKRQEEAEQRTKDDKDYAALLREVEAIISRSAKPLTQIEIFRAYGERRPAVADGSLELALSQLVTSAKVQNQMDPNVDLQTRYFVPRAA